MVMMMMMMISPTTAPTVSPDVDGFWQYTFQLTSSNCNILRQMVTTITSALSHHCHVYGVRQSVNSLQLLSLSLAN